MKRVFGIRHVHVIMIFSAVTLAYTLRLNMSVAIVAMTDKSKANPYYPEFPWNEMEKSKILSAFFWGYPVLQIIAGNIAEKFGAKQLIFVAMTSTGLLTIIIPMLADWGYFTVCILRILQGVLQTPPDYVTWLSGSQREGCVMDLSTAVVSGMGGPVDPSIFPTDSI
ncbi:hypothetical protein PGB90_004036 [Kerria lacca]